MNRGNQDVLLSVVVAQATVGTPGPVALQDPKDHGKNSSRGLQAGEEGQAVQASKESKAMTANVHARLLTLHRGHPALSVKLVTPG